MKTASNSVTITLRKVSTGARVIAFSMEDMNHAYSMATILARSPEYSRCYAVCTNWQNDVLFNLQPEQVRSEPAPYQAPQMHAPQPQQYQQPQQYAPPPGYAHPQMGAFQAPQAQPQPYYAPPAQPYAQPQGQLRQQYHAAPVVIEAEVVVEQNYRALPARR